MLPLLLIFQVAPTALPPPPPYPPAPAVAPAPDEPDDAASRPAQPWVTPMPPPAPPPAPRPADAAEPEQVHVFGRVELGIGTMGFSPNTSALAESGFGRAKMWVTMDGAYMIHRHVGLGAWIGLGRRAMESTNGYAAPTDSNDLQELAYFLGAEAPILVFGQRDYALHVIPRIAWAATELELDDDEGTPLRHTVGWGGAVSFTTFTYHLGISVGMLRAQVGPPGEVGRDHDFGGFYGALGGTIDG